MQPSLLDDNTLVTERKIGNVKSANDHAYMGMLLCMKGLELHHSKRSSLVTLIVLDWSGRIATGYRTAQMKPTNPAIYASNQGPCYDRMKDETRLERDVLISFIKVEYICKSGGKNSGGGPHHVSCR